MFLPSKVLQCFPMLENPEGRERLKIFELPIWHLKLEVTRLKPQVVEVIIEFCEYL